MSDLAHPKVPTAQPQSVDVRTRDESTPHVWIVLPAFNEQQGLDALLPKIRQMAESTSLDYEVVVVDDASTDETARVASQYSFQMPVVLQQHEVNQGLAGAIETGFNFVLSHGSPGDIIVTLDADDTQPPELIPSMLNRIEDGLDVVVASRYQRGSQTVGVPANRRALTWAARWMFKSITPIKGIRDYTCGFRAYRFDALKKAAEYHGEQFISEQGFSCMVDILLKMRRFHFSMGEVPMVLRYDQKDGPSKMDVSGTAVQTLKLLVRRRMGR